MDPSGLLTSIPSAIAATAAIVVKGFEIYAVDEGAKGLLHTTDHVAEELRQARVLRRQKSHLCTKIEKQVFDETFQRADNAVAQVAALAERARADIQVSGGALRMTTRVLFVLRDSPKMQVALTQLGIAHTSLSRDLGTLCSREGRATATSFVGGGRMSFEGELKPPPPTYEESMFLSEHRQRNMRRRASATPVDGSSRQSSFLRPPTPPLWHRGALNELPELGPGGIRSWNRASRTQENPFESFSQVSSFGIAFQQSENSRTESSTGEEDEAFELPADRPRSTPAYQASYTSCIPGNRPWSVPGPDIHPVPYRPPAPGSRVGSVGSNSSSFVSQSHASSLRNQRSGRQRAMGWMEMHSA